MLLGQSNTGGHRHLTTGHANCVSGICVQCKPKWLFGCDLTACTLHTTLYTTHVHTVHIARTHRTHCTHTPFTYTVHVVCIHCTYCAHTLHMLHCTHCVANKNLKIANKTLKIANKTLNIANKSLSSHLWTSSHFSKHSTTIQCNMYGTCVRYVCTVCVRTVCTVCMRSMYGVHVQYARHPHTVHVHWVGYCVTWTVHTFLSATEASNSEGKKHKWIHCLTVQQPFRVLSKWFPFGLHELLSAHSQRSRLMTNSSNLNDGAGHIKNTPHTSAHSNGME